MSFICFAHIKARRNPKSLLFLPSALLHCIALPSLSCTRLTCQSALSALGSVDREPGRTGIKILASLEREEEVKKKKKEEGDRKH